MVDTAGLRETADAIESEGIARSAGAARTADLVLAIRDGSRVDESPELESRSVVLVDNKCDLEAFRGRAGAVWVSAVTGAV